MTIHFSCGHSSGHVEDGTYVRIRAFNDLGERSIEYAVFCRDCTFIDNDALVIWSDKEEEEWLDGR